jgi:hypothetical protein
MFFSQSGWTLHKYELCAPGCPLIDYACVVDAFIGKQYQRRSKQAAAAQMAHIRSN